MVTKRKLLPLLLVVVLVVTAGCAGLGGTADSGGGGNGDLAGGEDSGDGGDGDAAVDQPGKDATVGGQPLRVDRAIIRTGSIELQVEEFGAARSAIAGQARSLDGYVSGSGSTRHTRDNDSWMTGHIVVRVPSDRFGDMLSFTGDRGTVLNEETETDDVTDQLVDLEARLANSKERRARLRTFYERANSTQELLRVEETLSSVQAEIEQLQAKKRSLEDQVAYATLRVQLREPKPEPAEATTADASLVSAFVDSTRTMIDYGYGILLFVVRLSPYLVVLGLPAVVLWMILRRRDTARIPWSSSGGSGVADSRTTREGEVASQESGDRGSEAGDGEDS